MKTLIAKFFVVSALLTLLTGCKEEALTATVRTGDAYPREEIIHVLPESEKTCPHDGAELKLIGSEDHEQLDIIPAQIKVLRHKRLKYACPRLRSTHCHRQ
ncbi:IS66 family transposase zinc-finger binding domain-containing protein [Microbulbifer epialgicus]|uniref:IS66 family transposase zinc-finger binding domain-containing protein n=1 Tax=Microbulbifer epialgicus TaxID=393907 RepID=A0ABV4NU21_9GAMM